MHSNIGVEVEGKQRFWVHRPAECRVGRDGIMVFNNSFHLLPLLHKLHFSLQVFLFKHYRNRRLGDPDFVLDFDEIYVIDSKTKSITRAKVLVRNCLLNWF